MQGGATPKDSADRPSHSSLTWEIGCFLVIGAASTVAQALLYWVLRGWWPPALANVVSLPTVTVLNTEVNRRLTFRRYPVPAMRAHLAAGGLFVLAYLTTSAAVLIFRHFRPTASRVAETLALVGAFALVTVLRFTVLRIAVFRHRVR
ncbi:membrane protein [Streptomyces albiflavescens]|uniref:Membrane protein n=1 Tax=Streptomyces albiflavescens TaxID=1623582 RepID=A0A917XRR6_9ACTN|nr:GtrA family protein [Streptomyces albiflavescens]GGN50817.1 membrane protein [Streptomyces albiflavescens]